VQLPEFKILFEDGGCFFNEDAGRIGLGEKLPPQFGHTPFNFLSTQSLQKVHSKVQIIASSESGGKSLSQHSQFGRSSSIDSFQKYCVY